MVKGGNMVRQKLLVCWKAAGSDKRQDESVWKTGSNGRSERGPARGGREGGRREVGTQVERGRS